MADKRAKTASRPFAPSPSSARPTQATVKQALAQKVFTHVTRSENVSKIMDKGLDPNFGGKGGASQAIGSDQFVKNSQNHIHLGLDSEGIVNKPSEFYSDFYHQKGIPSQVLSATVPDRSALKPDPDDHQGGRYKTAQKIPTDHIVHIPLDVAFRAPGTIGADYAPHNFVSHAGPTDERNMAQKTEDIRRAVHGTEETIYTDN